MTETTTSLPASGHGEVAAVLKQLAHARTTLSNDDISRPGTAQRDRHLERMAALDAASSLIDALTAQTAAPTPSPVEARADGVTPGPYEARICKGIPADCCDYGVVSLSEGREVCRVWREEDARAITTALAALESTPAQPDRGDSHALEKLIADAIEESEIRIGTQKYGDDIRIDIENLAALIAKVLPRDAAQIAKLTEENTSLQLWEERAQMTRVRAEARAERAESELAVIREALDFLAENTGRELSFDGKFFCEDDNPDLWVVTEVRGGRNDREWTTLGSGTTPLEALLAALANTAHRGQEEKGNG